MTRSLSRIAVLLAALLLVAGCTSDDGDASPTPTAIATATPLAGVSATTLALPAGCEAFDQGWWETPLWAGQPFEIELRPAACAHSALDALHAGGDGLRVTWTPAHVNVEGVETSAVLTYDADADRWTGAVTFPEPGQWRGDTALGSGQWIDIGWDDLDLRYPPGPGSLTGQRIVVFDDEGTAASNRWPAYAGGIGWLADPDRVVFVQPRDGGEVLVTGDLATDEVVPLFEVGRFTNVYPAPDGRAVAVEWGGLGGERHFCLLGADGAVTDIADGATSAMTVSWAPDAEALVVAGSQFHVLGADGAVRAERPVGPDGAPTVHWAPGGASAVLRYFAQGGSRIDRLDAASGDTEVAIEASADIQVQGVAGLAFSPSGEAIAVAWLDGDNSHKISVVPSSAFDAPTIRAQARAISGNGDAERITEIGGVAWSPDGASLAYQAIVGAPGSVVVVVNVATGRSATVARSDEFYATYVGAPTWSADGSMLFAVRYPCHGCGPGTSAVDAISTAEQHIVASFEDSTYIAATDDGSAHLISTPAGIVRTDGHAPGVAVHPGDVALFGRSAVSAHGRLAVLEGGGVGMRLLAARPAQSQAEFVGRLGLATEVGALLDRDAVIFRREGHWARLSLSTGTLDVYAGSSVLLEKGALVLSPSRDLLLELTPDGFAVLDADQPSRAAVVPFRPYPGDVAGTAAWSADERRVAFGDDFGIGVFDIASGEEHVFQLDQLGVGLDRTDDSRNRLWGITWSVDGDAVEFGSGGRLWRLDVASGSASAVMDAPRPGGFPQGTMLTRSPVDGTLVAATPYGVFVLDEDDPVGWRLISRLGVPVYGGTVHWSPDGTAVAFGAEEAASHVPYGIVVAPLAGGAYQFVAPYAGAMLDWLPTGELLWTHSTGGT